MAADSHLLFIEKPSRLKLLVGILLALFFNVGSYEAGYAIIIALSRFCGGGTAHGWTWRNVQHDRAIWYLHSPLAKPIYIY